MGKYAIITALILLALFTGFIFLEKSGTQARTSAPVSQQFSATSTYATTSFSVIYPSDFSVNGSYAYDQFGPKKLIHGVKFTIPAGMAAGTNLSLDTGVSVEQLPRAKHCTGDIYILPNVKAQTEMEGGVQYSVATTSGAAAGNLYEEEVYAIYGSNPCTAIRYFIHSGNIGNYEQGTVREFDRSALVLKFDEIRRSLQLTTQSI